MSPKQLTRRGSFGIILGVATCASARARDVDGPIFTNFGRPIDVSGLARGDWMRTMVGDDYPVFIRRRTISEIEAVRAESISLLSDPARDEDRAPDPQWIVVSGRCTHAGCDVVCGLGPFGGWACFCHGSYYDLSGRVRGGPARRNLPVVSYLKTGDFMTLLSSKE